MRRRRLLFVSSVFFLLGTFFIPVTWAVPYVSVPLTDTQYPDSNPRVNDNGYVVWAGHDGSDFEIYLHDGTNIHQLTNNTTSDMYPQINNDGYIVWEGHDGVDTEIYLYNGIELFPLTDNLTDDKSPRMNIHGQVVWKGNDGSDFEIFLFNGINIVQLTNNAADDDDPQINDQGFVVWTMDDDYDPVQEEGEREIFLYDGATIVQLTDNVADDKNPQLNNNGFLVWSGHDGSDWEIFFSDGTVTKQLTDNTFADSSPQINDDNTIVWSGVSGLDREIFIAAPCVDSDDDGFCAAEPDCDDMDPRVNPQRSEICYDGKDNDCDPLTTDNCPTVTVEIAASPSTISAGEGTELIWSSSNATSLVIDHGIGSVGLNGSHYFAPTETATYTITASGPDGVSTASIEIIVTGRLQELENKFIASDAAAYDHFGLVVDISGDFAIVGSAYDDNIFVDAGAAYIYQRGDTGWLEKEKIVAGDGRRGDSFGISVAIHGDYAIIGAMYSEYSFESSGAAYIFHYNGTQWVEQTKIRSAGTGIKFLGQSVAIADKYTVIGGDGKILIYRREGNSWMEMMTLNDPVASGYSTFGSLVAVYDDAIIVGSNETAHIYRFNGLVWFEEARLSGTSSANYISSVSLYGDYAAFGNMYADDSSFYTLGAVSLYYFNGAEWRQQAVLTPEVPSSGIGFGSSVDISGDYLVVGAKGFGYESYWNNNGWSYVFKRNGTEWNEKGKILASDGEANDYFGTAAAMSGANIIVGANGSLDAGSYTGSAYIYELPDVVVELNAAPEITPSGESILTWNSANADTCAIEPGIGNVPLNGNLTVSAESTTVYTLTCTNINETASVDTTVTVGYPPPVIIADSSPETIQLGEAITLSWNTLHADSVTIDNGIGIMPATGSVTVTPTETTLTYAVTAIGPGGEVSTAAAIAFVPIINAISATPVNIHAGEIVTLSWSTQFADSCTMEPGIGEVPCNGELIVTPAEISAINTYTLIAIGLGGSNTMSVDIAVSFPPPTLVHFNGFIYSGYRYQLEWLTENANSCIITPGIGSVTPGSGIKTGYIFQDTLYTITVTGPGGTISSSLPLFFASGPRMLLSILSPEQGESLNRQDVMVQGKVFHSQDLETGVIVNGVLALVDGNTFVANHVPLLDGQNPITAVATDNLGNTSESTVTIQTDTTGDYIKLISSKESGLPPLDFTLRVNGTFSVVDPVISYSGPGMPTVEVGTELNEFDVTLTEPGFYFFSAEAVDSLSNVYSDTVAVQIIDKSTLDALLRAKWEGMKTALMVQNIEGGLINIASDSQQNYRDIFNQLYAELPQVISDMLDIEMIYAVDGRAKYRINRLHDIDGTVVNTTYYIYFKINKKGFWQINKF